MNDYPTEKELKTIKMEVTEILRQIEMNLLKGRTEKYSEKLIIDYAKQSNEKLKEKIKTALLYVLQDWSKETTDDVLETIDSITQKFK